MRDAAPKLLTRDQLSWVTRLRADRDNVLAALRYWCEAGEADNALGLAVSLSIMALLLGNDTDMAEWTGEALAVPGAADPSLRVIAEAVHVLTSVMDPEGAQREGADPGLAERLDALDIEKYPVAGLLRPVFAVFTKNDGRVREYIDQARAGQDEWMAAAAWMMAASLAENDGNLAEMRSAAAEGVRRFRALGERWGLSNALRTMGNVLLLDGDLERRRARRTPRPAACSASSTTARTCPRSSSASPRSPHGAATSPGPVSCPRRPGRSRSRGDRPSTGASPPRGGRRPRSGGERSTRRARCLRRPRGTSRGSVPGIRPASTWRPWWRRPAR